MGTRYTVTMNRKEISRDSKFIRLVLLVQIVRKVDPFARFFSQVFVELVSDYELLLHINVNEFFIFSRFKISSEHNFS